MGGKNNCNRIGVVAAARSVLHAPLLLFMAAILALLAFVLALGADPPLLEAPPEARVAAAVAVPVTAAVAFGIMAWRDRFVVPVAFAVMFSGYAVWMFADGMGILP